MLHIIKPGSNFDFVGKRRFWLALSTLGIIASFVLMATKGLNYGIDFTGGAEVQVQVPKDWDIAKVRSTMDSAQFKGLRVQKISDENVNQFLIRVQGDESTLRQTSAQVEATLGKNLKAGEFEIQRVDVVGPAAGSTLRQSGFLAMFYALLCILIYVGIRFDFRYAPGAVLALFHDTVITLGIFVLTQKEFNLQILAAILALIGYSNNDTIIVFDRVRETAQKLPGKGILEVVNQSVNETLGRTLLTSLTTLLTVLSLWIFGGHVIADFAFTMMIGMIVGTYSSIFIASAFVIEFTHYKERRALLAKGGSVKKPSRSPKLEESVT